MLISRAKLCFLYSVITVAVIYLIGRINIDVANAVNNEILGTWSLYQQAEYELQDISVVSPYDGWIVGYEYNAANGAHVGSVILRWDGNQWTRVPSPTLRPLYAVKMISPDDGWAVGAVGTHLHWDGINWTDMSCSISNCFDLYAIDFSSTNDVWAVGKNGFHHWNGSVWEKSDFSSQDTYNDIAVISATNAWVVGRYGVSYPYQLLTMHWDGTSWTKSLINSCSYGLNSLNMLSSSSGWAVGASSCVFRFLGDWERILDSISYSALNDIEMLSENDGWLVGGTSTILDNSQGLVMHWDGFHWQEVDNPATKTLKRIEMYSANEGWAIGYGGNILHYSNYKYLFLPLLIR